MVLKLVLVIIAMVCSITAAILSISVLKDNAKLRKLLDDCDNNGDDDGDTREN